MMASLLHCLLQTCFEDENENENNNAYQPPRPAAPARMVRYASTSHGEDVDESDDGDDCCRPEPGTDNEQDGLHLFWRRLRDRWRIYESLEPVQSPPPPEGSISPSHAASRDVPFQRSAPFGIVRRSTSATGSSANNNKAPSDDEPTLSSLSPPPLRTARSFRHSGGTPAIEPEEVVLPGSDLQKQMAKAMSMGLEGQDWGDECVICMETFTKENPRMPTLCGCGENKTYFHLPCLYQYIEQSRDCPSCRKRLRWEEF